MGVMNELINQAAVDSLARVLAGAAPAIPWPQLSAAGATLDNLNLRGRADHVSEALLADLAAVQADYAAAARTFRRALPNGDFSGWALWPVTEAAVTLALAASGRRDFEDCLDLLAELTPRMTGEFAIRRLLAADPDRALAVVRSWTDHPDEHVRRLASEGTRPFLPWAVRSPALIARPEATVPILNALYRDPKEYVRRSVANHLNDLSRLAPAAVLETAAGWLEAPDDNTARVVRHGLRTLVKNAHPGALALLGFSPADLTVTPPRLDSDAVPLPGELAFEFGITNSGSAPARLAVDYVVHYLKANGTRSEKVFKLTSVMLGPGDARTFAKRHPFRQMTTRVHHPGPHALELQINGVRYGHTEFAVGEVP